MSKRRPRPWRGWAPVAGMLMAALGGLVFLLGILSLGRSARLALFGRETVGRTVDRIEVPSRRRPTFTPIIEYLTEDGRTVRFKATVSSRGAGFEIGALVPVIYLPEAPDEAELKDTRLQWIGRAVPCLVGGLIGVAGLGVAGVIRGQGGPQG